MIKFDRPDPVRLMPQFQDRMMNTSDIQGAKARPLIVRETTKEEQTKPFEQIKQPKLNVNQYFDPKSKFAVKSRREPGQNSQITDSIDHFKKTFETTNPMYKLCTSFKQINYSKAREDANQLEYNNNQYLNRKNSFKTNKTSESQYQQQSIQNSYLSQNSDPNKFVGINNINNYEKNQYQAVSKNKDYSNSQSYMIRDQLYSQQMENQKMREMASHHQQQQQEQILNRPKQVQFQAQPDVINEGLKYNILDNRIQQAPKKKAIRYGSSLNNLQNDSFNFQAQIPQSYSTYSSNNLLQKQDGRELMAGGYGLQK